MPNTEGLRVEVPTESEVRIKKDPRNIHTECTKIGIIGRLRISEGTQIL